MESNKTVAIGSDHAGYELKESIKKYMDEKGYQMEDHGTSSSESTDYPEYAHAVANSVAEDNDVNQGILICGSGNGISMSANKHSGIRAALCWDKEVAVLAKQHTDANIVALPAGFITTEEALGIIDAFLEEEFEGGRHQRRVDKIDQ
ncbi:MAG TPA: ribose 5-phosphate isomerase B [Flavobacteriales bacterium]|jgi:ribose 5-phosphate isomerase B|nr:ribose 5-phosphate isomerase B [Flavobacteriales bacterium]HIO67135.1 ribose 5-phosphate isomerase B [Flavobacteriales bacterium]